MSTPVPAGAPPQPVEQLVVTVRAPGGSADDLAVSLRSEMPVVAQHGSRIVRILLHIESLRLLRIIHHEDRAIVILHQQRLILGAEIVAHRTGMLAFFCSVGGPRRRNRSAGTAP